MDVQVVVVARVRPAEEACIGGGFEVLDVEDVCSGVVVVRRAFIALVVHQEEAVVGGHPTLMAKARTRVGCGVPDQ